MFKILLVVSYPKLEELVKRIYFTHFLRPDLQVDIRLIRAEEIEQASWEEKYDLIIGRGYSAIVLKQKSPDTPVIEIPITGYDIMRALLTTHETFGRKKTAVILTSACNHDANVLSFLAETAVLVRDMSDFGGAAEAVKWAMQEGCQCIIGGKSVTFAAEEAGIPSFTVESGEEAIMQVFLEAIHMMETICKERERRKIYKTITQTSNDGIVYVDENGKIELANKRILQMIVTAEGTAHGRNIAEVYPFFTKNYRIVMQSGQPLYNELHDVQQTTFSVDYIPVTLEQKIVGVVITCQSVLKIQQRESQIRKELFEKGLVANYTFSDIVRRSELMEKTVSIAAKYAQVSSNILIVGETGTGKELMAQSIHNASERRNGPFVAVNCAAIPENLLESELFGYVDGAFTGSRKGGKIGVFEQAHKGTLFLDEISEIPINFQGKLLRVLQERQVRRIGDDKVIDIDTRIIAATNRNLRQMVEKKEFRQDLLFRLDVLKIYIPPLRERTEDIIPLFGRFLQEYNTRFGKDIVGCDKRAEELLVNYDFGGNIRELQNITERAVVMCDEDQIDGVLMEAALYPSDVTAAEDDPSNEEKIKNPVISEKTDRDREKIIEALRRAGGKKGAAAELLGIDRSTLWRKMRAYHIE